MNPSSSDTFPPLYTTSPRHLTLASPLPLGSGAPAAARLPITFKPVATKAEKFAELSRLDRHKLERPKAHFRNALKTTEGLERVTKQLDKRLAEIESKGEGISFERLTAFRDAFEDIIKLNRTYGPKLNTIKEVYNEHLLFMLSQQRDVGHMPSVPMTYHKCSESRDELEQLRRKIHQMEVESRVLLQDNERLSQQLSAEVKYHESEVTRICEEAEAKMERLLMRTPPPKDYAAQVEEIQDKIVQRQEAISQEYQRRKGSVPLSVCHNLEQCLREVEIETQKHHRKNKRLRDDIKKSEEKILSALQETKLELPSDLGTVLGFS